MKKKITFCIVFLNSILTFSQVLQPILNNNLPEPPEPSHIPATNIVASYNKLNNESFTNVTHFSNGLAAISFRYDNGKIEKWGFINKNGALVIPAIYDRILFEFKKGISIVSLNKKTLVINKLGKNIIPQDHSFYNGGDDFVTIKKNNYYGLIDYKGKIVVPALYDLIYCIPKTKLIKVWKANRVGYLNNNGKEVINLNYSSLGDYVFNNPILAEKNRKWGYIDINNKEVISFKYDQAFGFKEERARVQKNNKWGFINNNGEEIISIIYDQVDDFSDGFAGVELNKKWGFIDYKGKLVIPTIYDSTSEFKNGLVKVSINNKWGVVNKKGEIIIPIIFEDITEGQDYLNYSSHIVSYSVTLNKKIGFINRFGKSISLIKYDEVFHLSDNISLVISNQKYGLINRESGFETVSLENDFIYPEINEGLIRVIRNGKKGFVDLNGKIIIPIIYDEINKFSEGLAAVVLNNEFFFINKKNEKVLTL